ncbi:alcohol dehydrogenase zinc-binding domain-containing protein [Amniculicola lignicola CBS 123094]|uniref:Alcohol dehydrogenase zinc-binding domain-containing protein n=1 Tax=Amniculicola lignicola CBS 123094 TaxID=1392246 RepID=A0A6A5WBS4_9PLEO|nr:alcohol dehydrogenase zinc-binding domain-containing protein [Amniculicola lignicola CBS 123094]
MTTSNNNIAWGIPSDATSVKQLTKITLPTPVPGPNQALVRLTATSLNFRDLLIVTHSPAYPGIHKSNLVPSADGAGIIDSTGPSSKWAGHEGTKVILHPNTWISGDVQNLDLGKIYGGFDNDGTLQSWKVVEDERIIEAPKGLTGGEGASLITAGVPAWSAIRESLDGRLDGTMAPWKDGKRLEGKTLLTMGTGGVSCFAIQIASALGATVIVTSSSDDKLARCKALGATHLINYAKNPDWDQEIVRLTGRGVDHVIELGGHETLLKSVNCTRPGGIISVIGILSRAQDIPADLIPSVLYSGRIIKGCVAFSRDLTAEFARFVEEHGIKPVIAREYDFDNAVEAFEALEKQNSMGKIVIKISEE